MKAIGYARESTRDQAVYGFNLDDQCKKIEAYTELYFEGKHCELQIIREEGASAKSLNRPKMQEIIAMVKNREFDVLIVHNLDRLTRQVADLAELLKIFEENNVQLVSITENINTKEPVGRFFIFLIVLIAQWEEETISSRTRRGVEESLRQGNYAAPGAPFGYKRDPDDNHKLIINEDEAKIVRRVFESIAQKGYSITALAHEFNAEKLLEMHWDKARISRMIENTIYYGTYFKYGKEYRNLAPKIVSKDLYDEANRKEPGFRHSPKRKYIYKGLVYCTSCKRPLHCRHTINKIGKHYHYYGCYGCGKQVAEKEITDMIREKMDQILQELECETELQKMSKKFKFLSDILEKVPMSSVLNVDEDGGLASLITAESVERDKFEKCIDVLRSEVRSLHFEDLPFLRKREIALDYIKEILFNPEDGSIVINYWDS